jgi:hypothetical protein
MTTPHFSQPTSYPERPQPAQPDPALARAFALLGEPWNGLIIATLARGPVDTAQMRERVPGISDDTLADRLQDLTTVDLAVSAARSTISRPRAARACPTACCSTRNSRRRPGRSCSPHVHRAPRPQSAAVAEDLAMFTHMFPGRIGVSIARGCQTR